MATPLCAQRARARALSSAARRHRLPAGRASSSPTSCARTSRSRGSSFSGRKRERVSGFVRSAARAAPIRTASRCWPASSPRRPARSGCSTTRRRSTLLVHVLDLVDESDWVRADQAPLRSRCWRSSTMTQRHPGLVRDHRAAHARARHGAAPPGASCAGRARRTGCSASTRST